MKDLSQSLRDIVDGAARPVTPREAMVRSGHTRGGDPATSAYAAADGLWLDDDRHPARRRVASGPRVAIAVAIAACLLAIAVPAIVFSTAGRSHDAGRHAGNARQKVLAALSATTDSGSFDFTYDLSSIPAAGASTTAPMTTCQAVTGGASIPPAFTGGSASNATTIPPVCEPQQTDVEEDVTGSGVIDTNPMAMVASANIGDGLDVVVRVNPQTVYELGTGSSTGLLPSPSDANAAGQPLSGFAGLVEGTLGTDNGAVAMLGMASPTGFLDLYQQDFSSASQIGTSTVGGVPVTEYQVTQDLGQLPSEPGLSPEETATVKAALALLDQSGYVSETADVFVDQSGYIEQVKSTLDFADGSTTSLEATFSDFGCAGTVVMPGQQGSGTPPAGCSSPNSTATRSANQSSTSSSVPSSTPTTSGAPTTGATVPVTTSTTVTTTGGTGTGASSTTTPSTTTSSTAPAAGG